MRKTLTLVMALAAIACSSPKHEVVTANGDTGNKKSSALEVQIPVEKVELANGLTVLIVPNHKLPIFSYYTFYKVGSKFEGKGITGASHFLEHMMFKGAKKFPEGVFDHYIEANGGNTNAFTTYDQTVYYQNLPLPTLEKIVEMEADRMENLALNPDSFEKERQVILEERKMRYENSPGGQLYQLMLEEMMKGTPYETSVIGSIPDLKSVTRDQIQEYFKTFYAPNNAIIVVVGDVDSKKLMKLIEKNFGSIPKSEKLAELKAKVEKDELFKGKPNFGKVYKVKGETPEPLFALAYAGDKIGTRRAFVMDLLSNILTEGVGSYLNQKFVSGDKQILSGIDAANYNLENSGVFFLKGSLLKGKNFDAFIKDLKSTLKKSCDVAITDQSMQKTKNQYLISAYGELETNDGTAIFLGTRESLFGDFRFYEKEFAIYDSITKEEIISECKKIFGTDKSVLFSLWEKN
ncbi:MAG: M16 family metallopeptidase [Bacteriovoracaceae bacterium]